MFKYVYFEISGGCNAACPYCVNGRNRVLPQAYPPNRRFLSADKLEETLKTLEEKQLISPDVSVISLFNWGEPFRHPDLAAIFDVMVARGYHYNISTNGSIYRDISKKHLSYMSSITFSLSGFSQATYGSIHGFELNNILKNICRFTEDWCVKGVMPRRFMNYHIYQHNWQEIPKAEQFCRQLGIELNLSYASFGHFELGARFLTGRLDQETRERCMSELFTFFYRSMVRPASYRCPQFDRLVLDEQGNVILCCGADPSFPDYSFGPATELSAAEIVLRHEQSISCQYCQKIGLDYAGHERPSW